MSEKKKRSILRRLFWSGIRIYVAICVGVYVFQGYLLYHPTYEELAQAARRFEKLELEPWPSMADYRNLGPAGDGEHGRIFVWAHGNAGSAAGQKEMLQRFRSLDADIHLYEFPGYGPRPGEVNEESLVADLARTLELIAAAEPGKPIILGGESLGTAVVCGAVARTKAPIACLLLMTPFTRLADAAQELYWFLPARFLVRDDYDNVAHLRGREIPLALVMAGADETVAPELQRRLFESYSGPKRLWLLPDSSHIWRHSITPAKEREIVAFIDAHVAR